MTTYLFDTSVVMAHFTREPCGAEAVKLLSDSSCEIVTCVVTWLEFAGRLTEKGFSEREKSNILEAYRELIPVRYDIDEEVVKLAAQLRDETRPRLPAMDALIAGCAWVHNAVLVHNDAHMDAIPAGRLTCHKLSVPPPTAGDVPMIVREAGGSYRAARKRKERVK